MSASLDFNHISDETLHHSSLRAKNSTDLGKIIGAEPFNDRPNEAIT